MRSKRQPILTCSSMEKKIKIDVMILGGAKFYCTLTYQYNPLFKLEFGDIINHVYNKRPTLRYRNDVQIVIITDF